MEGKKISFGFMKTKKVEKVPVEEKKEFIECVEEKSIKVVGGEIIQENTPLVIPMKPNTLITAERLKEIADKVESVLVEAEPTNKEISIREKPPENETIEQMAVRELMEDAKKEVKVDTSKLMVALSSKPVIEGEKESSLDDYEAVPVQEFGMAMLRGMGWTQDNEQSKYKQPQLRPKGLGLGADKVITENQKKKSTKDNKNDEELTIVKNSFVKITTGKFSGYYGKIVSLDEDNGRVVVDIPIKKETVSLSEFMMYPVTKSEYDKESRVINADTFEEYKKSDMEPRKSKNHDKGNSSKASVIQDDKRNDHKEDRRQKNNDQASNGRTREKDRRRRNSSSSEDRPSQRRNRENTKYCSSESLSSLSDHGKKHKKKERRHRSSSSESCDSYKKKEKRGSMSQGKRDIDKKRKGKKKKRDRDRSPNYKKYRK